MPEGDKNTKNIKDPKTEARPMKLGSKKQKVVNKVQIRLRVR